MPNDTTVLQIVPRRLTRELRRELEMFRGFVHQALGPRVRVRPDAEAWPVAPGRYGQLEWRGLEAAARTPETRARIRRLERVARIGRLHTNRAPQSDDSAMPTSWGPLTVIEKIGQGTFGDVYRARETRLDRDVALKLLRHKDAGTAAVIESAGFLHVSDALFAYNSGELGAVRVTETDGDS